MPVISSKKKYKTLAVEACVLQNTHNLVISNCCSAEDGNEMYNKHLMTGFKGNGEFCFPETLNVPRGEGKGNIEVVSRGTSR